MKNKIQKLTKTAILFLGLSLLLWNCEKDSEISHSILEESIMTSEPKIETFSLDQLNNNNDFKELKNTYQILQNNSLAKSTKTNSFSYRLTDTLGITIDANYIKKISYDNYTSYTMLMIEENDTSNNFSNLVIQEYNGVKRIFTMRYFPFIAKNNSYASKNSIESFNGDIQMLSGINPYEIWDDGTGGGGSGGSTGTDCEEYQTICNTVNIWIPHGCGCGHMPGQSCDGCNGSYPYYTLETQEECQEICMWEGYNRQTGSNQNNNSTGGGSGGSTSTGNDSTNVATTPVNPDGTIPDQVLIDSNFEDEECLKIVYDAIGKATKFQEYLQQFDSDASIVNLKFTIDNDFGNNNQDYSNAMAITNPPLSSNEIIIAFNTDSNSSGKYKRQTRCF